MKIFGHINDSSTGAPMPYVNIATPFRAQGQSSMVRASAPMLGTATKGGVFNKGKFSLESGSIMPNTVFSISHVGYNTVQKNASQLQGQTIYLSPLVVSMPEVVVTGTKYDPKKTTKGWLKGLSKGWQVTQPTPRPIVAPNAENNYVVGDPRYGQENPPYYPVNTREKTNKTLLYVGIGLGVISIVAVIITLIKNKK